VLFNVFLKIHGRLTIWFIQREKPLTLTGFPTPKSPRHGSFLTSDTGGLGSYQIWRATAQSGRFYSLTSGTAALRPGAGWALAASICGAIEGLVKAMAVELAPLRVNCVVPGVIKTSLWDSMSENDRQDMYDYYENQLLVKRVGQAENVALGFLYLIRQSFGTGQSLVIDGGTLLV
jgi:NAD(P)-dependent dehydrogenase (short-subunit alcohol dehydrogenase family)